MCSKCGQSAIADGGIGCICHSCKICNELSADKNGYCFLCRPCHCGRSIQMHTSSQLDICKKKNEKNTYIKC